MAGLKVPDHVALIAYPKGVRIRRVRVRAIPHSPAKSQSKKPLIVSRRALRESRDAEQ
jgi:hypothetical protein